jgi:hypothetical protein
MNKEHNESIFFTPHRLPGKKKIETNYGIQVQRH